MQGLMMERPLLISGLLEHAATIHADREIVSYAPEEPVDRRHRRQSDAGRERSRCRRLKPSATLLSKKAAKGKARWPNGSARPP